MSIHPADLDRAHVWHPFTPMGEWIASKPIILTRGKGPHLWDAQGNRYLDGNSSIWTNLHGHAHPRINRAIRRQLAQVAHVSFLGQGNVPAAQLAARLIALVQKSAPRLSKVFYSDDGSTAIETALKMSFQYWIQREDEPPRRKYLSLDGAYHGDTVGAVALGHCGVFDRKFRPLVVKATKLPSPHRCAVSKALRKAEAELKTRKYAALVVEPLIQGAAGMWTHPRGYLKAIAKLCRETGTLLILDEVMTGFGRTGTMFAFEQERAAPDFLCLAKGLSGGYLPLAATLTTEKIFDAFVGDYAEMKTFFHGHSYTGNALGCAAALANLEIFETDRVLERIAALEKVFEYGLEPIAKLPSVLEVRRRGLICGIELCDPGTRKTFPFEKRMGAKVCAAARARGVLTRPIGSVVVLMPPYCLTDRQLQDLCKAIHDSIRETCE